MRDMYGNVVDESTIKVVASTTAEEARLYALKQAKECERLARVHTARGRPRQAAAEAAKAAKYRKEAA